MDKARETITTDLPAARRRLAAFLPAEGYKPDLLARIGRMSMSLKEPAQAGRYWLLSDATGPDVEAAVEAFVQSCQSVPERVVAELPRFKRDWEVEAFAAPARKRVARYGLLPHLEARRPAGAKKTGRWRALLERIFRRRPAGP